MVYAQNTDYCPTANLTQQDYDDLPESKWWGTCWTCQWPVSRQKNPRNCNGCPFRKQTTAQLPTRIITETMRKNKIARCENWCDKDQYHTEY